MTCRDCIYFKRCVALGVELDMHHDKEADKNCRCFKNKTDFEEVVRCRDCKYMKTIFPMKSKGEEAIEAHVCYLSKWSENSLGVSVMDSDFCSYGERKE